MIKFSGQIKPDIQAKVENKEKLSMALYALSFFSVLVIALLIAWLCDGISGALFIEVSGGGAFMLLLYGVIYCFPTLSSWIVNSWDFTIEFGSQTITSVLNHTKGFESRYKICKVKKVVDYGAYYFIYMRRLDPNNGIVCQKDLLTEGTIEEFEELFKDKIIRKGK